MTCVERLQATGIRRRGEASRGFRYTLASGGRVPRTDLERIQALRLPPAWRDAAISPSPHARVQAVGRDAAGRWQYVYHPAYVRARERRKHERLLRFGEALPRLRRAVQRDLRLSGLPRDKVLAAVVRILASAFLRPGSESYAAENGSYGIATLRRKHVTVKGDTVLFDFAGKGGKRQQRAMRDRQVAAVIKRLLRLPGYEVFKYAEVDGRTVDIKRAHINEYIKRNMGTAFSAKDFRTWAGTLICACLLARAHADERPQGARAIKRMLAAAMRETATQLGNTPAVCRASYVNAHVPQAFASGRVIERAFDALEELTERTLRGRHACEDALLALLSDAKSTRTRRAPLRAAMPVAARRSARPIAEYATRRRTAAG
ncbi:MAG: DNA topoisomerase IB [Candidatus Binatia bacterium]